MQQLSALNTPHGFFDRYDSIVPDIEKQFEGKARRLKQVHGNTVIYCNETSLQSVIEEGDGMVTDRPGIILTIYTADCVPVLFVDQKQNIVGAAHAGWRGAVAGVLQNTIAAMQKLGAQDVKAAIGPCIHQSSYEVDQQFYDQFLKQDAENDRFFIASKNRYRFDLPGYVEGQLRQTSVRHIYNVNQDTYSQPEHYYSYRYNTHQNIKDTGRLISAITPNIR